MKKILVGILSVVLIMVGIALAANEQSTGGRYEYATVDTDPNSDPNDATEVYGTNAVLPHQLKTDGRQVPGCWFSVGGSGTMTVTLQFKRTVDSDWNDYGSYTATTMEFVEATGFGVQWRAIVKEADYTSGEKIFGFDW